MSYARVLSAGGSSTEVIVVGFIVPQNAKKKHVTEGIKEETKLEALSTRQE